MVEMLGNSESIFKRHYKKPVPHEQAVKFFEALAGLDELVKKPSKKHSSVKPG